VGGWHTPLHDPPRGHKRNKGKWSGLRGFLLPCLVPWPNYAQALGWDELRIDPNNGHATASPLFLYISLSLCPSAAQPTVGLGAPSPLPRPLCLLHHSGPPTASLPRHLSRSSSGAFVTQPRPVFLDPPLAPPCMNYNLGLSFHLDCRLIVHVFGRSISNIIFL
jgi:hypothetical protein